MPMVEPITIEITVASRPTVREIRDPQTVSARTERPKLSVPNGNSQLGALNGAPLHSQVALRAPSSAMRGAAAATTMKNARMNRPAIPIEFLRYIRQIRDADRRRRA